MGSQMQSDDDFDPVEFIKQQRSQDEAWKALQGPLAKVLREPAMVMLAGVKATHLRGFDLTRKLCKR